MPDPVAYTVMQPAVRANLLRDRLLQAETEHCRLTIAVEYPAAGVPNPGDQSRLAELEAQIRRLRAALDDAEKQPPRG